MNLIQKQIIDLLNASIHNTVPKLDYSKDVDWDEVINEANAHSITGLIYPALKNIKDNNIDKDIIDKLKKITFYSAIRQSNHIKRTAEILKLFNENNIPVIVLKGLVVREYYPKPDLRTMCDSDVIIYKSDLERVRKLLLERGFHEEEDAGHHIAFMKADFNLEIHWTLANETFRKGQECFQEKIWDDAMKVKVGRVDTLSLSLEDLALHLCAHMASHMAISGFGVRQLADLVLLVEHKGNEIKWNEFREKAEKSGLTQFSTGMFKVCNYLFGMEIPKELNIENKSEDDEIIKLVVNDIFTGGVYGQRDLSFSFRAQVGYDIDDDSTFSMLKRYIQVILPPPSKLSDRYAYAKKYKILLPIAWIHHIYVGITSKEYDSESKKKFLTSTISNAKSRNKVVRWLEL
ncbi:nucleotidyltransferase family protein [Clostridium cuniculi]|uniref:nucleotidyltransferase domain-containing protein n=1 Tax=Clostridium cuniculi TaxID=2548455 RepID=UPI0010544E27|nr:nucleotidyltransferase family protein [Clostridium cuniculi]